MDPWPGEEEEWGEAPPTVYRAPDAIRLGLAKSLLLDAGIPFVVVGEGLQNLFGAGSLGGYNLLVGPAEIRVPPQYEEEARRILGELL